MCRSCKCSLFEKEIEIISCPRTAENLQPQLNLLGFIKEGGKKISCKKLEFYCQRTFKVIK